MTSRRFPAPWRADPMPGGYVVRDANGQALAYLYSRDNEAEARQANGGAFRPRPVLNGEEISQKTQCLRALRRC
jgi:hypothetical protein